MIGVLAAALFFGIVAFLGIHASRMVCAGVRPFDDGPPLGKPPASILTTASALVGVLFVTHGAAPLQLGIVAITIFAIVACWCSDVTCGIVPDAFTLAPLGVLVLFSLTHGEWWIVVSAFVPFVPFALAAFLSHGSGMGWGDAKLVALAGAVLGAPLAILAMAAACIAAIILYRLKGLERGPIAFAPYIAGSIGIALPLGILR